MPTEGRRERGTASVEFVLVAPLLLLVLMLAYNSGVLGFAFIDESVALRRSAHYGASWRHSGAAAAGIACFSVDNNDHYARGLVGCRTTVDGDHAAFLDDMEQAGNDAVGGLLGLTVDDPVRGITQVIREDTPPSVTRAYSALRYRAWGGWAGEAFGTVRWVRSHSISSNRSWELRDLPAGYNAFLHEKLESADELFPTVFARRN